MSLKIKKTKVQPDAEVNEAPKATYDEAISFIRSAIESLGVSGADDEKAKDAIANLSVILFDLQ